MSISSISPTAAGYQELPLPIEASKKEPVLKESSPFRAWGESGQKKLSSTGAPALTEDLLSQNSKVFWEKWPAKSWKKTA